MESSSSSSSMSSSISSSSSSLLEQRGHPNNYTFPQSHHQPAPHDSNGSDSNGFAIDDELTMTAPMTKQNSSSLLLNNKSLPVSQSEHQDPKLSTENHPKLLDIETSGDSTQPGSDDLDSDDEYISSGEDEALDALESPASRHHHLTYGTGIAEHTAFFEKSLGDALDSVSLDSSLALQAQLSGHLNDKSKLLAEKQTQILDRVETLKSLYKQYIGENKLGDLEKDIETLALRIRHLKHGHSKTTLFRKKNTLGVVDQYPIEYNQAKDKVLERASN